MRALLLAVLLVNATLAPAKSENIEVEDYLGRTISLPKPAQRVVALAPHIVENVYAAGAGSTLVGAVDYCNYPEEANNIPRVGSISSFSLEAIIASKPDLVLVWHSGRGGEVLKKLDRLGIPAYAGDPHTLEDVARSIRDYGKLTANEPQAESAAQNFERRLKNLHKTYSHQKPISVLYQVWNDPIQTLNDEHIISDVIRLCGGTNAFGGSRALAPKISVESVMARDPDAIIASGMAEERPEWLDEWKKWPLLKAVKHGDLYSIPPDIIQRHTPRILDGAEMMCSHLGNTRSKERL